MNKTTLTLLAASVAAIISTSVGVTTSAAGATVSLEEKEKQTCEENGGCVLITENHLRAELLKAYQAGAAAELKACRLGT
jgi:hypothetical protein